MQSPAVLLVEDNADDIELTLRSFQKLNLSHEIIVARNGVEAVEYLKTGTPVLILLDLKMPKMDGFDFLRRIRAEDATRYTPVVVLTTSAQPNDRIESYHLGANSYIRKPMNFDHFVEAVRQVGAYWLSLNLLAPVPAKTITGDI